MKSTIHEHQKNIFKIVSKTVKNTIAQIKKIGLLIAFGLAIVSCTPPPVPTPPPPPCSTTGTDFQNIFTTVLGSNSLYDNYIFMDLVTHEYTFKMLATKQICKIGYEGNTNLASLTTPYTIEIWDTTSTPTLIYTENQSFGSTLTYYTPFTTLTLNAGSTYTIKRIVNNYGGNITNTIGRICRFNSGGLPSGATATGSYMKILSSNFYGTGGPVPNYGIPFIDIAFQ